MAKRSHETIVWQGVEVKTEGKSMKAVKCLFCEHEFSGSASRLREHFLTGGSVKRCVPKEAKKQSAAVFFKKLEDEIEEKQKKKQRTQVGSTLVTGGQASITGFLTRPVTKDDADNAIADYFFECAVPFNHRKERSFIAMVSTLLRLSSHSGYTPPTPAALSGPLLQQAVLTMDTSMNGVIEKDGAAFGLTLASDGWTDVNGEQLMNFVVSTSKASHYVSNLQTSMHSKTKEWVATTIVSEMRKMPFHKHIVHIILDGAQASSLPLIEAEESAVLTSICTCHTIDLLLEDLGDASKRSTCEQFSWYNSVVQKAVAFIVFVAARQRVVAQLQKHATKRLLKPNETRFGTHFLALSRLHEIKEGVRTMLVSDDYDKWADGCKTAGAKRAARKWKEDLNDTFWSEVKEITKISEIIFSELRAFDGKATVEEVVPFFKRLKLTLTARPVTAFITPARRDDMIKTVDSRYRYHVRDIHLVAFLLSPKYRNEAAQDPAANPAFHRVLTKFVVGTTQQQLRVLEEYQEWLDTAFEGLSLMASQSWEGFRWWSQFGGAWGALQPIAKKILAQPSSSSPAERAWSAFGHVQTKARNRLTPEKANNLTRVFFNKRNTHASRTITQYWATEEVEVGDDIVGEQE
ncbi:hypothetical protein DIPPA_03682 [Diplonema papillatum]|nr:hypothetical protein DIPPA_03682 [Diplonema papillatum]